MFGIGLLMGARSIRLGGKILLNYVMHVQFVVCLHIFYFLVLYLHLRVFPLEK